MSRGQLWPSRRIQQSSHATWSACDTTCVACTPFVNTSLFGQSATDTFPLKSWLATGVLALAAFQLYSALWIYGRLPWRKPAWLGTVHRVSGYSAIFLSLPIAYHCMFAYGFRDFDRRTVVHSLAGCFFYGAFAAKVIVVRSRRLPGWVLPVAGGTMLTLVVVLWYSAALWYFNGFDSPGLTPSVSAARSTYPSYPTTGGRPSATAAGVVPIAYQGLAIAPECNTPEDEHQGDKRRPDDGERDPDGGHGGAEQRDERDQDVRVERSEIASVALHQCEVAMQDVDSGDRLDRLIGVERDLAAHDQADHEAERDDQTESPDGEPFRRGPFSHCPTG